MHHVTCIIYQNKYFANCFILKLSKKLKKKQISFIEFFPIFISCWYLNKNVIKKPITKIKLDINQEYSS